MTQTIPTGGVLPTSGFAGDFNGNGFTDLVVGNTADGRIALFLGGAGGLSLSQTHHQRRGAEPDVAELRGGLRRRAQLLRRHRRPRGGLASGLQPEPAARPDARRAFPAQTLAGTTVQSTGAVLSAATTGVFQQVGLAPGLGQLGVRPDRAAVHGVGHPG